MRTRRADLAVRHRESFRRRGASDRAASALTAAATLGQTENPLEISLSLGEGRPDGKKRSGEIVPIAVGIPLRLLALVPQGDERRGSVSVRVSIQDARGRLLESGVTIVPIVVPEGDIERALAATWYHRAEVRLSAGPATRRGGGRRPGLGRSGDGFRRGRDPHGELTQASSWR